MKPGTIQNELWAKIESDELQLTYANSELCEFKQIWNRRIRLARDNIVLLQADPRLVKHSAAICLFLLVLVFGGSTALVWYRGPSEKELEFASNAFVPLLVFCLWVLFVVVMSTKEYVDAAPYLKFDAVAQQIELSRYGQTFERSKIDHLQWITGDTGEDTFEPCRNTVLNLIVSTEQQGLVRFEIWYSPDRQRVREFSERSQIPVIEVKPPLFRRFRRDLDKNSVI